MDVCTRGISSKFPVIVLELCQRQTCVVTDLYWMNYFHCNTKVLYLYSKISDKDGEGFHSMGR